MTSVLKIHEMTRADGSLAAVLLAIEDGALLLRSDGEGALPLPSGAVAAVMRRFGGALDPAERLSPVAQLELGGGRVLRHVRHRPITDVIARDWLVYEAPGEEPRCALATTVAGALAHLARAAR